MLEVNSTYISP